MAFVVFSVVAVVVGVVVVSIVSCWSCHLFVRNCFRVLVLGGDFFIDRHVANVERHDRKILYDLDHVTLFLHFFNNYLVHEYDQDGNLKDYGKVENGKFKRDYKRISKPEEENPLRLFDFSNVIEENPPFSTSTEAENTSPMNQIFNGYYPPNDFPRAENNSLYYSDDSSDVSSDDSIQSEPFMDWKSLYEHHYEGEEFNGMPN